jgi:hypothetical protein
MATKLDVINNILVRLREKPVNASEDSDYGRLVSSIVAEAYEEVLDEWNWRPVAQSSYVEIPALATDVVPDATNTKFGPVLDSRLVVAREHGFASIFTHKKLWIDFDDFFSGGEGGVPIKELSLPDFSVLRTERPLPNPTPYLPTHVTVRPLPDETVALFVYPVSAVPFTLQVDYYRRPARMDGTNATDAVNFEIPFRPVQELALMYVLNERGEEMGEPGNLAQGRYIQALSTAKEIDLKAGEHSNSFEWGRD